MLFRVVIVVILCGLGLRPTFAADITVTTGAGVSFVTVTGDFENGDGEAFIAKTKKLHRVTVSFNSHGGNLIAGMMIGEFAHANHFTTLVLNECESSCALAWLGGTNRLISDQAQLGFHAASTVENGVARESSDGNALGGAYMAHVGIPYEAIRVFTATRSTSILWVSANDLRKLGIAVTSFAPEQQVDNQDDRAAARSVAGIFKRDFRRGGVDRVNASVRQCYDHVSASTLPNCVALDVFLMTINDITVADHGQSNSFNTPSNVKRRLMDGSRAVKADPAIALRHGIEVEQLARLEMQGDKQFTAEIGRCAERELSNKNCAK